MLMVCSLPPPVHGQSLVSDALVHYFEQSGRKFDIQDISPGNNTGVLYHVTRVGRVFAALAKVCISKHDIIYLSSEAKFGVFYLIGIVGIGRILRKKMFLHHHVYSYINENSILHNFLIWLTGRGCVHIMLSPKMGKDFKERFGKHHCCINLHNACFIDDVMQKKYERDENTGEKYTLGFIGRLESSKGFDSFIELVEKFQDNERIHFMVGGEYRDTEYEARVRSLQAELGARFELCGFVKNERKAEFYRSIDLLFFPSRYVNEASPMVCFEALAVGVPVVVTRVGAVVDIVDGECGVVLDLTTDLVEQMAGVAQRYVGDAGLREAWQAGATARFAGLWDRSREELIHLEELLFTGTSRSGAHEEMPRPGER